MPITMNVTLRTLNVTLRTLTAAAAVTLGSVGALAADAPAGQPAALVEDIAGTLPGVQPMDYLSTGQTVSLASGQALSLSYLASCVTETITGGTVTVGVRESTVAGGMVERATLPCDGGKLLLAANEAGKAGVTVFRSVPVTLPGARPNPQFTLFKTRPMLLVSAPGPVTFERLDGEAADLTVDVAGTSLDMAKGGIALAPGGLYKVTSADKSLIVQIDPQAKDEGGPALGRLLRF